MIAPRNAQATYSLSHLNSQVADTPPEPEPFEVEVPDTEKKGLEELRLSGITL